MTEEWRPIEGWELFYEVSSIGNVRSLRSGALMKQETNKQGAKRVTLQARGEKSRVFVHRLVCVAFNGSPPDGLSDVLHWDDNPSNNISSNLRWGNAKMNWLDAVRNGTHKYSSGFCPRGHKYKKLNSGRERCKVCENLKSISTYKEKVASGLAENDPRHGLYSGYRAGCRETCCTAANSAYKANYYASKREAKNANNNLD